MTKDEALKLALEALETSRPFDSYPPLWRVYEKTINNAITAIKEALAQPESDWTPERIAGMARLKEAQNKKLAHPEQEYHAVNAVHKGQQCYVKTQKEQDSGIVTAGGFDPRTQRTWVGLTEKDICEAAVKSQDGISPRNDTLRFAIAIEAKLKEKNHD